MEAKGLRMNTGKTKVMVSGKNKGHVEKFGKLPCTVCGKGTGSNSIRCTGCHEWVFILLLYFIQTSRFESES